MEEKIKELRIVPDSSWLIALIDEKDSHHIAAKSSVGAILPYKPVFYISAIVYLETISHFVRVNKISVKKSFDKIEKLLNSLNCRHSKSLELKEIVHKYKSFSRVKISKMRPMDFYIATEGIFLSAKILTCDIGMYKYVEKYYKDIYFLTDKVKNQISDLGRLIENIQKINL